MTNSQSAKYRKRPVVIDAVQWFPDPDVEANAHGNPGKEYEDYAGVVYVDTDKGMLATIASKEGPHLISPGYWIITGVQGERYGCAPDIFEATYEPASSVPSTLHGQEPK